MTDVIVYAIGAGYEIKVWLYDIPTDIERSELTELAKAEFERVGITLKNEYFEFEYF